MTRCDIVLGIDPRFTGGTAAALLADAEAFLDLGLTLGLIFVTSEFFQGAGDAPNPNLIALGAHDGVEIIAPGSTVSCDLAFLHHPLAFASPFPEIFSLTAHRVVLVAHHPCFRGDGSLEYNPVLVARNIRDGLGVDVDWAPVSGVVRAQLRSFCPLIRLTSADWGNLFDPRGWQASRPAFDGARPVVGRHSRPDRLKWPSTAQTVADSLTAGPDWRVRVMGWPEDDFPFHVDADHWEVVPFNGIPVPDFLNGIDVFAYHFSDLWVEAFGRTITEAMLMERPCLLDPRLDATFGDLATYCAPAEVAGHLERLRADPETARTRAREVRAQVVAHMSAAAIAPRLEALRRDTGTRSRAGTKTAAPFTALRKAIGLMRRSRG
ncbi:MAG: glycosyltransferase family 1 protein [Pseudomonadota bacterium]